MSDRDNYSGRMKSAVISDLLKKPNEIAAALSDSGVTFEKMKLYGVAALYTESYVDNLIAIFDGQAVDLESLGDLFSFKDLIEFVDFNKPPDASDNTDLMRSERFRDKLIGNYKALCVVLVSDDKPPFSKERVGLIEEAFSLYDHAFYAGAVCLLLSIFEGVLTEYLVFKGFIKLRSGGKFFILSKKECTGRNSGLYKKLEVAKDNGCDRFFSSKFFDNVFLSEDCVRFSDFRNSVLHGDALSFSSAEYCRMTFFLVYLLVLYAGKNVELKVVHGVEGQHASP